MHKHDIQTDKPSRYAKIIHRIGKSKLQYTLGLGVISLATTGLSGCLVQEARVDRWTDLERPCQPHGFYIAPAGDSLNDVASTCKTDESVLRRYNAWLLTRQPFTKPTVVWLKQNPNIKPEDETLIVDAVLVPASRGMMSSEQLTPSRSAH